MWLPWQFEQVDVTSGVFVHSLVLWVPAHLTQTAFLLQFVEECPCAWQR